MSINAVIKKKVKTGRGRMGVKFRDERRERILFGLLDADESGF